MRFNTPYNVPETHSEAHGLVIDSEEENENMTKQEFAEEVDINTILRRFKITGELPTGVRAPTYADFSEVYDFHSAANAIAEANEAFDQMPAEVRLRFENDPAKFIAFVDKEENRPEAERLGLVFPKPATIPEIREDFKTPETASTETVPAAPSSKETT